LYPEYVSPQYLNDSRIQNIILSNAIKLKKMEKCENAFPFIHKNIYDILENTNSHVPSDMDHLFSFTNRKRQNYNSNTKTINDMDYGVINNICTYYTLFGYIKKAFQYSNPYIIPSESIIIKKSMFSNFLLLWNYIYSHKSLYIENYIPNDDDCIEHNEYYRRHCLYNNSLYDQSRQFVFSRSHYSSNKIKIGYISNGFANSVVSNFISPILNHHNRELFEIHLFVFDKKINFELIHTDNLYIHILSEDPLQNASLIYNLNIGILIDLDTFTGFGLNTLSKNPAPIQITYIGYPNSTGLDFIHYRITDNIADNPDSSQHNKEKLLKLPGCFLLYKSILQNEFIDNYDYNKSNIILGALNEEIKNSVNILFAWKCILERNPTCKLLIKIKTKDGIETKTEYYTKKLNVDKSRLIIVPYSTNSSYIQTFQTVDIVLDTFPYSGTTTTCNALYNSSPIVTMYNKHFHCHNVSSSILMQCGLKELITFSVEEYVDNVTYLCNNIDVIHEYKRTIHKKFVDAMDPYMFMKGYENALIEVYNKLQNSLQ
jgi:predicted O-linked N-acetylglucosamine transferase (SPINDLY family)